MKKRLLSTVLALSMLFSIIPTSVFASNTYSGEFDKRSSPILGLSIKATDGKITSVSLKPNPDTHNAPSNMAVSIYTNFSYYTGVGTYGDDAWTFVAGDGYNPEAITNETSFLDSMNASSGKRVGDLPGYFGKGEINNNSATLQAISNVEQNYPFTPAGIQEAFTAQDYAVSQNLLDSFAEAGEAVVIMDSEDSEEAIITEDGFDALMQKNGVKAGQVPVRIFVVSGAPGSDGVNNRFYYDAFINASGDTTINVPADDTPNPTPTQDTTKYVGDVTVSVTDPIVGVAPSTSGTASGENAGTSATVAWDTTTNALTPNGKFDANKVYKANVTVNAADDAEFKAGSKVTVNGTAITLTDEMISFDKKSATVEYTPAATDKLKVTSVTASGNLTKNEYKPDESFNASGLKATITYNNGEQVTDIDVTNNNYGVFAALAENAQDASSDSNGATLALDSPKNVFIVYNHAEDSTSTDIDATGGLVKSTIAATITVANAKITTAQVSVTYPKPGETPDTVATVPDGANYTAEVTWEYNGTGVTGNFEYDKAYDAIITVKPNTGYALDNTNGVVLTVKDKTVTNPGADKTATIASDDIDVDGNGEKSVSFDATASTPISASISDSFDLYDKNDVNITLTLGTHVIGDITGITIDGQTLSSSDYTISGNIIKVKGASLATKLTGLTSTAANKNVEITVTGQQDATTATLSAIDTTPYITITDPTQGAITGVTHTSGTKVALTKNTAYTLSAPTVAHTTGYTWTVSGITTGTDNGQTYTFTPSGSENITATVALTVDAGHKLTINKTGNGTVTVAKDGGSTLAAESDGTYTVYSDESYTVTATADDQYKVTAVTGETIDGVKNEVSHVIASPSADTTVEVTFAEKTAPTVSADMTYRKGANVGNQTFTITLGDYSGVTVSGDPSGTWSENNTKYTVSSTDLDSATNGDHTYTFDFGEGMTISKKITVLAARSITSVTAPTGTFAHGDTFKLDGLAFTVKEGETSTTYSYNGTSWDNTLPTGTQFSLDGTNFSEWDAFKAAAEAKITRHDTTDSTAVNNGDQITVSLGNGVTGASGTISVGQKAITVTPSQTTGINKDYDGTVKAPALTATIPDGELVGDDVVTASVTAVYQDGVAAGLTDKNASDNDKNVVFTATLAGANKDNYTIKTIANGSGKINKRTVKIAIINNVPDATKNKADTKTGSATATIPTNTEYDLNTLYEVVDGETVAITYDYSYANISSVGRVSDVTVRNIATTNTNYTVEPTYLENQNGTVNNRTIKTIAISNPDKNVYNYSDTFDPTGIKVTVTYDGETDSVVYAWNDVPDDITLKWTGTDEALSATHKFDSAGTYTITASATGVGSATTGNITVNKLKVNVTASGNITKVYDGKTDLDADDAITYDVTNQSAGYDTQFNADTVTVSNNPAVYDGTSVSTNGVTINKADLTLSNSNYEIENFTNNVTASITARHITVTAITVPTVKQYSNDTDVPVENVGTSAVTFDNVVSGENVTVDYKYTYNDTSVAGDTSNITINNLVLNSTNTVNNNYTLDESILTKSGHVDEREVDSLTVTAPTQFATAQTYGTALALAGLKVQVNFTSGGTSDGSETYVWKNVSTWTKQVEGQTDVDVTTVPFTLAWSGTTDVPTQGETLNVQRSTKGITASYTGTSVTGTSDQITVNPITLTKIKITGTDQTKVYDGNADLTPNPAFTYAITEGIINSDPVTVAPNTVEYAEADVHTSEPLNITGFHLTNNNDGNYALGTPNVTGTPNGTITKRPITLTAITNIPAINRFEAGTGTDQTATSAANGGATFEAAGTDTGIVSGQTVTVIYNYEYDDNQTVSNNAVVNLSNVRLDTASNKNYSLTNNATATGVVNEVEATAVTVTIPDKTYEYGDKLDLTGTTVTVDYGNTNTEVYTSDDGVNWKKNNTAVSEKPFTITLPTDKDSLAVGTATVSVKVKDGVEDSVSRTVNKRKVTVTPAKNGDVTKVYNGNTTYTNGVIEWTVRSVNSIDGLTVTLPTVSSATYTYNDSAVALANKITVSDPQLSDTNNFEINGYTDQEFDATITLRPLVITGITIPDVNKYADVSQEVTGETANSATNGGATFEATGTDTGIVSGETVGVTFDYKYVTSNPESGTTTDVDISNIALDNRVGTSANYSLTPNSLTGSANVVERTIDSITVANPTQFNSDVTYNDKLSIAGLKVTINYTDRTSEVYTATVVNDVVSWALGSVNISADNIPFTLSWKDTAKGGTFAQGQTLSVTGHNGNQIVANHKNGNDSGEGSAVTIKPIEITSINATKNGDITKTYNGDTELNDASKSNIGYTSTQVIGGDTVTLGATPAYENKNVGQNKAISFTTPTVSGNDNYTLGTDATVTGDVVGDITVKTVEISNVYIPSIYKDTEDLVKSISNASAIASGHPTANTVVAADILSGDRANLTFAYELTYANSTDDNPTVTISDTSITGTESGNYEFAWPTGLTGTVIADAFTDATITAPTNMSYTHGDTFNPTGLSVTIKTSSHPTGTTYTVTGTEGNYKWDTDLPAGVNVSLGSISLNSNDALNFKAHYKNMKDQKIKVSAGEKKAETGVVTMLQKQLTATASIDAADKTYDSTTGLTSDQHVTYKIGDNGVQSFNGTADNVSVTANASYKDANVSKTDTTINNVGITFTNIGLDGDDKDNYIAPTSIEEISGKINPKSITVTVTSVADILAGVSGDDLKKTASINYSEQPESGVSVTVTATYPDSTQDPAGQKTEKALTFTKTETGNELGNYVFTLDENGVKGYVVSNIINEINVTTPPQTEYTHGDNLSLKGMVIEVKYQDSRDDNIYTCQADGTWKDKNSTTITELPVSFALEKNGTENALTSQTQQLRRDTNDGAILVVKGGDESNKDTTLTVNKKEITQITIPNPVPSPEKTYDGTTTVTQSISYEGVGVLDADKATVNSLISATANYDTKDVAFDSDGTTVASKAINFTNPTMNENDNYTMSSSATVTTTITGKINPKDLTVTITSVPSIIVGQSTTVTLEKGADKNYTQSGEVEVNGVKEEVNLTVTGEYAQNSIAQENVNVTYSVTNKDSYKNYNITWNSNVKGTVNKKPITKIEVTNPTTSTWSHGDILTLDGMKIKVTYSDGDTKTYTHSGGAWDNTPEDVTITWGDTSNSATDGVIRLDDTNKGLTADDNNKTTSVKVTSKVKDTNGEYQSASTGDITLTKKQLTLTVSGNIEKVYDNTNALTSLNKNSVTLTLNGVAGSDGVTLSDSTKDNIQYGGTTVADTASSPKLVIGTVVLNDNANNQYYILPSDASITNNTTGKINKRPVKVTSVTKNMDTTVDSPKTGTLEKVVQLSTDGYGISGDAGFYSILDGHTIMVDIPYEYEDTSSEGIKTVTYDNVTAKVSAKGTDGNADYVDNYDVTFDIKNGSATISNGTVTGIKIETTGKTKYTHGDLFDLKGTKITVIYNDGAKTDIYEYDTKGKWIKNVTGTPAELPSEIGISLGNTTINAKPTSDTDKTVVRYDKLNPTKELKATYTKSGSDTVSSTDNPSITLNRKPVTITVDNGTDAINHTYSGNNSLTVDEIGKLTITEPTNFTVGSDDVTLTKGTLSATIGSNTNGNVDKNLAISVSGYELSGNDADKYEIKYVSTATGDITKAPLTITISSVPSINENATDLKKILTKDVNYTQSGEVTVNGNKETVNATVQGTYPNSTYTGGSADKNVSYTVTNADEYPNYDITISGSPKGTVTQKTATVEIINQPKFVTDTTRPQHGDKLGTDGLNGFEYTVSYSDGTTTKHKYENGDWLTTDGYTEPENGTVFTWTNTNTPVSSDSEIRRDMDNKIKITVPTATNEPFTNKATADKKKVKITANGTYTKVYDGTNTVTLNETTPEITYTVSGVATGDTVTVTATPAFVDENVAKFGDVYQKAINFTNVSIKNEDGTDTDNYEIVADENGVVIAPIMGAITPKTINITALTVPSSTKGSAGEKTVTKNKNFTTTDILEKDKDNVTIGYKATFVTSATGTVDATVTDAKVDGSNDQMTLNYVVGTVTGAKIEITSSNPGGGGGGGGGGNSLSIKYENADGTAGKDVSKIEAPAGSDPVDLIAVFVTKPANPTVIWTSDNESVATVDENGIVKFIGEGTAIITAQSKTNKTLKDTVTVTVTKAVATPTPKPANPTPEPTKEPSIITKTMLNPYIVGYDDNVFGPELPISREEVSAIFARLIANNIYMDKEYDTSFPDVGEGWSKDYIGYLEKFSVVTGYEDGTFRPQNYITRAEMAVMMAKAEGYDISGYMSSDELAYPDVDEGYSEWAVKAIKYLTDRGIMEGYPDGTFGPNRPITRAETVATVNRVLADMTVGNIEVLPSDMTEAHWAYNDVVFAMNHRILKDVAADESQFIKSEEYDKNKITETEVVEDTSDENAGAGASPTPEPSPTPNA